MNRICIADKILAHRERNGMTQGQFGALFGVTAQAVSKWERTLCYPDITILAQLSEVLECSIGELLGVRENEGSHK
ncbi:MAG: helix-turn-helix transcriptional regulator [Clostridia bacterium]|nr:helix-turn-helix transcriptional regulator [Clostridia bacterium]